jgi:hypothetical protein
MGAPARAGPESKTFIRAPVVTPWALGFGVTEVTRGIGTAVVVVVARALAVVVACALAVVVARAAVVVVACALAVVVARAAGVATGGGAGVWEPRASRCLCPDAALADTSPPVATSAKSAVAAIAAR